MSAQQDHIVPVNDFIVGLVAQYACDFVRMNSHDFFCFIRVIVDETPGDLPALRIDYTDRIPLVKGFRRQL